MTRNFVREQNSQIRPFRVWPLGITTRVALLIVITVLIPMILTSWLIESSRLLPGNNYFFAFPIAVIFLLVPIARMIAHVLINHDLKTINHFCDEIKKGNYHNYFELGNESENEDEFLVLLRNLTWLSQGLARRQEALEHRYENVQRQYMAMEEQAFTDALTGLYNRHYLEHIYDKKPLKNNAAISVVSVIFIDCDGFKLVNDNLGHHTGDQLLRDLAAGIRKAIRQDTDIPLRMGGDEFAVLLPQTDGRQAEKIAYRIRLLYNRLNVPYTSLSIGVASSLCTTENYRCHLEELFRQADEQAYRIKQEGGNGIARNQAA